MKLTETLNGIKPLKRFTNYKAHGIFKDHYRPKVLAEKVSARGDKSNDAVCLQEMSMMLVCLQRHEFNEGLCSKEIKTFWQCQQKERGAHQAKLEAEAKGLLVKSGNKFPSKYINKLLEQYPQPKK